MANLMLYGIITYCAAYLWITTRGFLRGLGMLERMSVISPSRKTLTIQWITYFFANFPAAFAISLSAYILWRF